MACPGSSAFCASSSISRSDPATLHHYAARRQTPSTP